MDKLQSGLNRSDFWSVFLLTIPWSLALLGGYRTASLPGVGVANLLWMGAMALGVLLLAAMLYATAVLRFSNALRELALPESKPYRFWSLFRIERDRLSLARRAGKKTLFLCWMQLLLLPLALLLMAADCWALALVALIFWVGAGFGSRRRIAWFASDGAVYPAFRVRLAACALILAVLGSYFYVHAMALRMEKRVLQELARLEDAGVPLTAGDLDALRRGLSPEASDKVMALGNIPVPPAKMLQKLQPTWTSNLPVESYVEMDQFLAANAGCVESLQVIERYPSAKQPLDYAGGESDRKACRTYQALSELERMRLLCAASFGNRKQMWEIWRGWENLRRQLSGEPSGVCGRAAIQLAGDRVNALERMLNEFGDDSETELRRRIADLAATEGEMSKNAGLVSEGDRAGLVMQAGHFRDGFDAFVRKLLDESGVRSGWLNAELVFPVIRWWKAAEMLAMLQGLEKTGKSAAEPAQFAELRIWMETLPPGMVLSKLLIADRMETAELYGNLAKKLRAARIGLALEIWQRRHGGFPDTLDKLAPEILPEIPLDPFTGKALSYQVGKFEVTGVDFTTGRSMEMKFEGAEIGGKEGFRVLKR